MLGPPGRFSPEIPLHPRRLCHQSAAHRDDPTSERNNSVRRSPLGIQLISSSLYDQIFKDSSVKSDEPHRQSEATSEALTHLRAHGLWGRSPATVPDAEFSLPPLVGDNIDEHFRRIAEDQTRPYKDALEAISRCSLPPRPKPEEWRYEPGWTKYPSYYGSPASARPISVPCPDGNALVFDVEVCVNENQVPTIAVAASDTHWFSWCAERLVGNSSTDLQRGGGPDSTVWHGDVDYRTSIGFMKCG